MKVIVREDITRNIRYEDILYIEDGILIPGKEYEATGFGLGYWYHRYTSNQNFTIPKEYKFMIDIITYGSKHSFRNDYFLSTEEMRDLKINKLINEGNS